MNVKILSTCLLYVPLSAWGYWLSSLWLIFCSLILILMGSHLSLQHFGLQKESTNCWKAEQSSLILLIFLQLIKPIKLLFIYNMFCGNILFFFSCCSSFQQFLHVVEQQMINQTRHEMKKYYAYINFSVAMQTRNI